MDRTDTARSPVESRWAKARKRKEVSAIARAALRAARIEVVEVLPSTSTAPPILDAPNAAENTDRADTARTPVESRWAKARKRQAVSAIATAVRLTDRSQLVRQLRQENASLRLQLRQKEMKIRQLQREQQQRSPLKKIPLDRLTAHAQVQQSHQISSLLNGRDCRRFLQFVGDRHDIILFYRHPKTKAVYDLRPVLRELRNVERWAIAAHINNFDGLEEDVSAFSAEWRRVALPSTNKLHLLEAHLADFLRVHNSWGLFGEQGMEAMHHVANVAAEKCIGINANNRLPFFFKRQLVASITDASEFDATSRSHSESQCSVGEIFRDDDIPLGQEVEVEWYDEYDL